MAGHRPWSEIRPRRKEYVVGFMLDWERSSVVLVRKNSPEWQAGRLNGVGGKVEPSETAVEAMAREFAEEAGWETSAANWQHLCTISWKNDERVDDKASCVHFFRYISLTGNLERCVRTMTDEPIEVHEIAELDPAELIKNLTWLIPLATYMDDRYEPFEVTAQVEWA